MSEAGTKHEYIGLKLTQKPDAPVMYLLTADADSLLEWADVPNAKADYMAGYQRVYSKERADAITEFLTSDRNNIIPGAIIVAIQGDALEVERVAGLDDSVVRLSVSSHGGDLASLLSSVYEQFSARLSEQEKHSIDTRVVSESFPSDTGNGTDFAVEPPEDSLVDDQLSGIPESYLAVLASELRDAVEDFDQLAPNRRVAIESYVRSVSKPGLIIDGQHRVFGAKNVSAHQVKLPVVLMPSASMAEQVFHFYVLNNKAKPLSPLELRRTISTSLSDKEIDLLWTRFDNAGVDPEAARLTHKVNSDPRSPFRDLIDFGLGGSGFLKENVVFQLVSKFVKMPRRYQTLYRGVDNWESGSLDDRLSTFYVVWFAIRGRYQTAWNSAIEDRSGQIFYKAALLVIQEYILDFLRQQMNINRTTGKRSPFSDEAELATLVTAALSDLPEKFFTTEWQVKQIDTTEGRKLLRNQLQEVIDDQGSKMGTKTLFRKKS